MRYVVLLHQAEGVWAAADEAEQARYVEAHQAFDRALAESCTVLACEALSAVANTTTVRWDGARRVLSDGPFVETAEQLTGFYLVDAPDLDTLLTACSALPHAYTLEVRPTADVG